MLKVLSTWMSDWFYPTPKHSVEIVTTPGINTTRSIVGVHFLKHTSYKAWKGRKKEKTWKKTQSYQLHKDMLIRDLYANRIV